MTTKMPDDPKIPFAIKTAKFMGPSKFAHYSTVLMPSAKTASFSPVLPVVSAQLRATTPPTSYINPERLMDDVGELYAAHQRVFKSLDALDAAARYAGTPIRSGSPRERFTHLLGVIREVETTARKAWQDELIAAGGTDRSLHLALKKGAKNDTLYVTQLLTKQGETSDGHKATDSKDPSADLDRTHNSNGPSDHVETSATPNPIALAFKPRTGLPKQATGKPFGPRIPTVVKVRQILKDGGWGTDRVTHDELLLLISLFSTTSDADANDTIRALSDAELKQIADDIDSSGLGNYAGLTTGQKESFLFKLATQLNPTQFVRVAKAFDDDEQIASVIAQTTGAQRLASEFIAYCEFKFNHTDSEERRNSAALATAITIAEMSPKDLMTFFSEHSQPSAFVTAVFKASARHTTTSQKFNTYDINGSTETRTTHHFDPTLLLRLNQVATQMTTAPESTCFAIFQGTIDTLKWVTGYAMDPASKEKVQAVLQTATTLPLPNLSNFFQVHSGQHATFVEWMRLLLKFGQTSRIVSLVSATTESSGGDWRWPGYLLAIVDRAAEKVKQERDDALNLASDLISAFLNAASLGFQILGESAKTLALYVRSTVKSGEDLGKFLETGIAKALEGKGFEVERDRYIVGKNDGNLGR
jgi:hypothetical protein